MPNGRDEETLIKIKERLRRIAQNRWPGNKKRQDKYVFGRLRQLGWKPKDER